LALRVAAEHAAAQPAVPLGRLVNDLTDQQRRLALLDAGGDQRAAVSAVFSWSLRHLPPPAARMFRLLGLHPGTQFDAYAAAALADSDLGPANAALDQLARAHLIQPTRPGRYGMHDLLRAFAASIATSGDVVGAEPVDKQQAALRRLFDYYLATAAAAMDALLPAEAQRRPRIPPAKTPMPTLADPDTARGWLDTERPTLVAAATHGWPALTVALSTTLYRYLVLGHSSDAVTIHSAARDAARQRNDPTGEAKALTGLGAVHWRMGHYELAGQHLQRALDLSRQAGDQMGEASILGNLGLVEARLGRLDGAVDYLRQTLALTRQTGDTFSEANALTNLGEAEIRLGQTQKALHHLRQALTAAREHDMPRVEAHALDNLGVVYTRLDQPARAADHHRKAVAIFRRLGDRDGESWALNSLGEAATRAGQPGEGITHHTAAHAAALHTSSRDQQARAQAGLGDAHRALGDFIRAREHYERALALHVELGLAETDAVRARLVTLQTTAN
jgi:tetratricopeptide (TPR) repeat protein